MTVDNRNEVTIDTNFDDPADKFFQIVKLMMAGFDGEKVRKPEEQASLDRVKKVLEEADFTVGEFPPWFPIDLYASRKATDWLLIEVKECVKWSLDQVAGHPCHGAFIPLHKIDFLGTGRQCGFDFTALAYMFKDDENIYFIPHEELHQCKKKLHPLWNKIDKNKIQREGELSLSVSKVNRWAGILSFENYMKIMRENGRY